MAESKLKELLTFREIEFIIQMQDKDSGFHELRELLYAELTRFEDTRTRNEKHENPIREFLKTNIERSIVIRDSTRMYFVDYQEKGSFTIKFTVILITGYLNYGTIRQALDYLVKDTIGNYFEELLERHIPVNITIQATDKQQYDIPTHGLESKFNKSRLTGIFIPLILSSLAFIGTLFIGVILLYRTSHTVDVRKSADEYREKYLELLIEKQLEDVYEKEKYKNLIRKTIESTYDSTTNFDSKEKK
jgi:hypothetical protein